MSAPLISCIVAAFNSERYVEEALQSILGQTYHPLEIIVSDDGSTDGTAAVVARFGEQVQYLSQPTAGPPATRNLGLRAAKGEFVAFLDADDLWHKEKLARQMARFQARPDLQLCVTHVQNFWIPELSDEAARYKDHLRAQALPGYISGTLLARRALFDTVGQWNTALFFGDAMDWFLRAARRGVVMELLPDVLVYHRMHHNNLVRRQAAASKDEFLKLVKGSLDGRRLNWETPSAYEFPASYWQRED